MLTISQVSKAFSGRTLFADVALQINRGDRIGLVGPNGAGKSTLLSLILQKDTPDSGTINLQRNVTIGFLPQESAPAGEETVLELATAITPEIQKLQKQLKAWENDHPAEIASGELCATVIGFLPDRWVTMNLPHASVTGIFMGPALVPTIVALSKLLPIPLVANRSPIWRTYSLFSAKPALRIQIRSGLGIALSWSKPVLVRTQASRPNPSAQE